MGKGSPVVGPLHGWDFRLQFWGFVISLHAKTQLWFFFNFYNAVCFTFWVVRFSRPQVTNQVPRGSRNSKTHTLSYLKCLLVCWWPLYFLAGMLSRKSQKSVRGLLSCFWSLSKTNSILISLTTEMVLLLEQLFLPACVVIPANKLPFTKHSLWLWPAPKVLWGTPSNFLYSFWCWSYYYYPHSVLCLVAQSCPTLCEPMEYSLPGSSVRGNSPGKNTGVRCHAQL